MEDAVFAEPVKRRTYERRPVNWAIEYQVAPWLDFFVHEGSKLVNISLSGACFLSMSDLPLGVELQIRIVPPFSLPRSLVLKGRVVRVDRQFDVALMFQAVGVRWQSPLDRAFRARLIDEMPDLESAAPV